MITCTRTERRVKDWLFPLPDFISQQSPYKPLKEVEEEFIATDLERKPEESRRKDLEDRLRSRLASELKSDHDDTARKVLEDIIDRGIKIWRGPKPNGGDEERFSWSNWADIVVDVGQHQRYRPSTQLCDADDLDVLLREARSVKKAKKRFQ